MSGFSADWLALREPLDLAARDSKVEAAFLGALPPRHLKVLDLASGAGSTVAAFSRTDRPTIEWILCDYDPALLAVAAARRYPVPPVAVQALETNLVTGLEALPLAEVDAVTTSAFLDLVSEEFMVRLVEAIVGARKPFLASLTYDGRTEFDPPLPLDLELLNALNADQRTDKGFGSALGPEAAGRAVALFRKAGYHVVEGPSDWQIGPQNSDFLSEFLSGWARVGVKQGGNSEMIGHWLAERQAQIRRGTLRMTVGHIDFVALPE